MADQQNQSTAKSTTDSDPDPTAARAAAVVSATPSPSVTTPAATTDTDSIEPPVVVSAPSAICLVYSLDGEPISLEDQPLVEKIKARIDERTPGIASIIDVRSTVICVFLEFLDRITKDIIKKNREKILKILKEQNLQPRNDPKIYTASTIPEVTAYRQMGLFADFYENYLLHFQCTNHFENLPAFIDTLSNFIELKKIPEFEEKAVDLLREINHFIGLLSTEYLVDKNLENEINQILEQIGGTLLQSNTKVLPTKKRPYIHDNKIFEVADKANIEEKLIPLTLRPSNAVHNFMKEEQGTPFSRLEKFIDCSYYWDKKNSKIEPIVPILLGITVKSIQEDEEKKQLLFKATITLKLPIKEDRQPSRRDLKNLVDDARDFLTHIRLNINKNDNKYLDARNCKLNLDPKGKYTDFSISDHFVTTIDATNVTDYCPFNIAEYNLSLKMHSTDLDFENKIKFVWKSRTPKEFIEFQYNSIEAGFSVDDSICILPKYEKKKDFTAFIESSKQFDEEFKPGDDPDKHLRIGQQFIPDGLLVLDEVNKNLDEILFCFYTKNSQEKNLTNIVLPCMLVPMIFCLSDDRESQIQIMFAALLTLVFTIPDDFGTGTICWYVMTLVLVGLAYPFQMFDGASDAVRWTVFGLSPILTLIFYNRQHNLEKELTKKNIIIRDLLKGLDDPAPRADGNNGSDAPPPPADGEVKTQENKRCSNCFSRIVTFRGSTGSNPSGANKQNVSNTSDSVQSTSTTPLLPTNPHSTNEPDDHHSSYSPPQEPQHK